ncbi:MAG TPA: TetR family transcriptional regulator [Galbitalea sp.]|jgi:AcrR family transcriptional regulator|nr:TetR family transcriptional regulator [Galbitalea sp.]
MTRWEPGARERLNSAALELYASKGFEETTVAEIAQAAGLTERTFFRYFADKREVLFAGSELLEQQMLDGAAAAPKSATAFEVARAAVTATAAYFPEDRRSYSRLRAKVITENPQLTERELRKMSSLAEAIAAALRERGIPEPTATLAAQSGVTVFRVTFAGWISEGERRSFVEIETETFAQLGAMTAKG